MIAYLSQSAQLVAARHRTWLVWAAVILIAGANPPDLGAALPTVTNSPTTGPITIDGLIGDQWLGTKPLAFISPPTDAGPLIAGKLTDPATNALWYAGMPGPLPEPVGTIPGPIPRPVMTTMFASLARTEPFGFNEFVADVTIPVDPVAIMPGPLPHPATIALQVRTGNLDTAAGVIYAVDLDGDGLGDVEAATLGIQAALRFEQVANMPGPIPRPADDPVLVLEVEVPLHIDLLVHPEYAALVPGGAVGIVGPDPGLWSANFANDAVDPPFAIGTVGFNSMGQTTITSGVPFPEPATFLLMALGAMGIALRRREK